MNQKGRKYDEIPRKTSENLDDYSLNDDRLVDKLTEETQTTNCDRNPVFVGFSNDEEVNELQEESRSHFNRINEVSALDSSEKTFVLRKNSPELEELRVIPAFEEEISFEDNESVFSSRSISIEDHSEVKMGDLRGETEIIPILKLPKTIRIPLKNPLLMSPKERSALKAANRALYNCFRAHLKLLRKSTLFKRPYHVYKWECIQLYQSTVYFGCYRSPLRCECLMGAMIAQSRPQYRILLKDVIIGYNYDNRGIFEHSELVSDMKYDWTQVAPLMLRGMNLVQFIAMIKVLNGELVIRDARKIHHLLNYLQSPRLETLWLSIVQREGFDLNQLDEAEQQTYQRLTNPQQVAAPLPDDILAE